MLLAKKNEMGVILSNEQNDFLLADFVQIEELEELSANICMMAIIQPANNESDEGPSYDSAFISDVQTPSTSYMNSLFSNINSGSVEHDKNAHDSHDNKLEQLAKNAYKEAEDQQIIANKADRKAKHLETELQNQFIQDRDKIRALEKERDDLQLNVSEQRKYVLKLQNAQTVLK
ncbi:hypothetical protein Tco_1521559 [Tanacetum coccineum]